MYSLKITVQLPVFVTERFAFKTEGTATKKTGQLVRVDRYCSVSIHSVAACY